MPEVCWTNTALSHCIRPYGRDFLSLLKDLCLTQLIVESTHILGNSLDLVCTDLGTHIIDTDVVTPGISDHFLVAGQFSARFLLSTSDNKNEVRFFHEADISDYRKSLKNFDDMIIEMISIGACIDEVWRVFQKGLTDAIGPYIPAKKRRVKPFLESIWFNLTAKKAKERQESVY